MYAACGSAPFGGWRHHLSPRFAGGTMGAGQWCQLGVMTAAERKPYNWASPGRKQANRPDGRWKCTPSAAYRRRLPRRGRFALHSASGLISISRHSAAKTSPSGGSGGQHQKGCISSAPQARLCGFRCLWQRCRRRRHTKLIARRAIPQPSAAKPLSNLAHRPSAL